MEITVELLEQRLRDKYYNSKLDLEKALYREYMQDVSRRHKEFKDDLAKAFNLTAWQTSYLLGIELKYNAKYQGQDNFRERKLEFFKIITKTLGLNKKSLPNTYTEGVQDTIEKMSARLRLSGHKISPDELADISFADFLILLDKNKIGYEVLP